MSAEQTLTWGGWIGTGLAAAVACYERFRGRRKDESKEVSAAKDELARVLTEDRDAWKSRANTTHDELEAYRKETHRKAEEIQAKLMQLTDDNARLRAATDITPVLKHQEEQSQINVKMLTALDEVLAHLARLTPCAGKAKSNPRKSAKL